jgi:hypothetical protein
MKVRLPIGPDLIDCEGSSVSAGSLELRRSGHSRAQDVIGIQVQGATRTQMRRDTIRFPTGTSLPNWLTLQSGGARSD